MFAQQLPALQQLVAAQQQLGKIDHTLALALVVVGGVQLDATARVVVIGFDVAGALPLFLRVVDEVGHAARRKLLVVDIQGLQQPLDRGKLILGVENLEGVRQPGIAVMGAQHAVAQTVEGTDPQPARDDRQHRRQAREHLTRCLVGEGDGQDPLRADLAGLDQPSHPGGEHPGLAAAGTREDEGVLGGQRDRCELRFIEIGEEVGHGGL